MAAYSTRSINDVHHVLQDLCSQATELDRALDDLQARKIAQTACIGVLHTATEQALVEALEHARALSSMVEATTELSESVGGKIRDLDLKTCRANECIDQTERLLVRSKAASGAREALEKGNFEIAADCVQQYLLVDAELDDSKSRDLDQEAAIQTAKSGLQSLIRERLKAAEATNNSQEFVKFLRLCIPLGAQREASERLISYWGHRISSHASTEYSKLVESDEPEASFSGALQAILGEIVGAITDAEDMLTSFGSKIAIEVLDGLQAKCDHWGTQVLRRFMSQNHMERTLSCIRDYQSRHRAAESDPKDLASELDPRQLEGILEELLLLCQIGEHYNSFLLSKAAIISGPNGLPKTYEISVRGGGFNLAIRELLAWYTELEEFYLDQSLEKAMAMDCWTTGSLGTSMIDDMFFVLQKCSQRSIATGSLQSAASILNQINILLGTKGIAALDKRWKRACAQLIEGIVSNLRGSVVEADAEHTHAAADLNNSELASSYTLKLQKQLARVILEHFTATNDQQVLQSLLEDMARTANGFKSLSEKAVQQLCSGAIPQMRGAFDDLANCAYQLTETEFAEKSEEYSWVDRFAGLLDTIITWIQPLLTIGTCEAFVLSLLSKIASRIEAVVQTKKMNHLGGLLLDKQVRALISTVADLTHLSIREQFTSLSQISMLLSLDTLSEMTEFWTDNIVAQQPTHLSLDNIVAMRVDLDP